MITFPRALGVAVGEPVASRQMASLADAINARWRSGLAEPWRKLFLMMSMFRNIRAGDGFAFPTQAEFFETFQMIAPEGGQWPVEEVGTPGGVRADNPMGAYVFGNEGAGLYSEEDRLANPGAGGLNIAGGTPREIWEVAKQQRGAYDPDTGGNSTPALSAARSHLSLSYSARSPFGNSYGGYMPSPVVLGYCTPIPGEQPEPSYEIFFTSLIDGSLRTYPGTCSDVDGNVAGIARTSLAYFVFLVGGGVDVLSVSEWLEGPYTGGGWIMKRPSQMLERFDNNFISDFRGTEAQRESEPWLSKAFDVQRFLNQQYHLAPQKGHMITPEEIAPDYQIFAFAGEETFPGGTLASVLPGGGEEYSLTPGFLMTAMLVTASQLVESATIELLNGDSVFLALRITPDEDGNFERIVTFDTPPNPEPLRIRLASSAQFETNEGKIEIEITELLQYKPERHDLFLLLRLGGCDSTASPTDGSGEQETLAREIGDSYFQNACILNLHGSLAPASTTTEINTNAFFDAARRLSKCVRIIPRQNFVGYEVADGKSICYFLRNGKGLNGAASSDLFEGLGPSPVAIQSGEIEPEIRYTVRTAQVTYADQNYQPGQVFTGLVGITEFYDSGEVFEYDGTYSTAPPEGWTNEWLMGMQFKVYHPSQSSEWKDESYSDYFFFSERCHFYHDEYAQVVQDQLDYGATPLSVAPEAPSSWRYVQGTNSISCGGDPTCESYRLRRYKSCRIYEPDPEVESITAQVEAGVEILKVTYKTRFRHCDSAPSTISRDVSTWVWADLNTEQNDDFVSDENMLRQFLLLANYGTHCSTGDRPGAAAAGSAIWGNPDDPYGPCCPHFYFTKLISSPREDGNDNQDPTDAPLIHDELKRAELDIRAMCEGFVDGKATGDFGCRAGITPVCDSDLSSIFDYTYENLCFDATGKRWAQILASVPTSIIPESETRPDVPQGFGPLPNTHLSSEVFNGLCACVNKLTKVRVMLPMSLEQKEAPGNATALSYADGQWPDPVQGCSTHGASYLDTTPPDVAALPGGPWQAASTLYSNINSGPTDLCDGESYEMLTSRSDTDYRYTLSDPDAEEAIPEALRDMLAEFGRVFACQVTSLDKIGVTYTQDVGEASFCGSPPQYWNDAGGYLKFINQNTSVTECVEVPSTGTVHAPPLQKSIFPIYGLGGPDNCNGAISNTVTISPITQIDSMFIDVPIV